MIPTAREVVKKSDNIIPPEVTPVIKEFVISSLKILQTSCHQCVTSNTLLSLTQNKSSIMCMK